MSDAYIQQAWITEDQFKTVGPSSGAYYNGNSITVNLWVIDSSSQVDKVTVSLLGSSGMAPPHSHQITSGITDSNPKNKGGKTVTFSINLIEYYRDAFEDNKTEGAKTEAEILDFFRQEYFNEIRIKLSAKVAGVWHATDNQRVYLYDAEGVNFTTSSRGGSIKVQSSKGINNGYDYKNGVKYPNYISSAPTISSSGARNTSNERKKDRFPNHSSNSSIYVEAETTSPKLSDGTEAKIIGYVIKTETYNAQGNNTNSYYNYYSSDSLTFNNFFNMTTDLANAASLKIRIAAISSIQQNEAIYSGTTLTGFNGHLVYSGAYSLTKMGTMTANNLTFTAVTGSINAASLTEEQNNTVFSIKGTNDYEIKSVTLQKISYNSRLLQDSTSFSISGENSEFFCTYSGILDRETSENILNNCAWNGGLYGKATIELQVTDFFGKAFNLFWANNSIYKVKGTIQWNDTALTIKTLPTEYNGVEDSLIKDSLILLPNETIGLTLPSFSFTGKKDSGSGYDYTFTVYYYNPNKKDEYTILYPFTPTGNQKFYAISFYSANNNPITTQYFPANDELSYSIFIDVGIQERNYGDTFSSFVISEPIYSQLRWKGEKLGFRFGRIGTAMIPNGTIYLNSQGFSFSLADNGGDDGSGLYNYTYNDYANYQQYVRHQEEINAFSYLKPTSISRTGKEKLVLTLRIRMEQGSDHWVNKDIKGTLAMSQFSATYGSQAIGVIRSNLVEGLRKTLPWDLMSWEAEGQDNFNISSFLQDVLPLPDSGNYIKGKKYMVGISGEYILSETKKLTIAINEGTWKWGSVFENNPTVGMRKNGIIINGLPGQTLEKVPGKEKGYYRLDINLLDNEDRIRIVFPLGTAEIYYGNDGKIHLSNMFVIDS